jgi:hypothetical protein
MTLPPSNDAALPAPAPQPTAPGAVPSQTPPPAAVPAQPQVPSASAARFRFTAGHLWLLVTAVLFIGWLSWLGFLALTKSSAPLVSHAQAAAATRAVRAKLTTGDDGRPRDDVTVVECLAIRTTNDQPPLLKELAPNSQITVTNLPSCAGYSGEGEYLLLLGRDARDGPAVEGRPVYYVVGQQRSPGADLANIGPPMIYRWSDETAGDLQRQVKRLFSDAPPQ